MEPNLGTELPEIELTKLILDLKKDGRFSEIIRIFLDLVRIRLAIILKSLNYSISDEMSTSDLLWMFSQVLKKEFDITVFNGKASQLSTFEEYLFQSNKHTHEKLRLIICNVIDLYYQLKDFDPCYLNVNFRERIIEKKRKQGKIYPLVNKLRYLNPLVKYIAGFKRKNHSFRKIQPFYRTSASIPFSISTILEQYVDTKFQEYLESIQQENQTITKMVEKILELQEIKKSLINSVGVANRSLFGPKYSRGMMMKRYLTVSADLMISISGIFLFQIFYLPQAWNVFVMFGGIILAVSGICVYIINKF